MERPKKNGAVAGLPDDPLVEILSRVPVKDLHRSKCVSKGWRDLIADPLHRKKLPQTLEGFFHAGDFIGLSGGSPPPVNPSFPFLRKLPGIGEICLRGSCNGLLLFRHAPSRSISYIVCNPATEQWAAVPSEHTPADKQDGESRTYLLFDPAVSSHFHLVTICAEERSLATLHTYSSKTGVWRHRHTDWAEEEKQLGQWTWGSPQITATVHGAAFFNGMLHVMLSDYQIAVVDMERKIQGIIPTSSIRLDIAGLERWLELVCFLAQPVSSSQTGHIVDPRHLPLFIGQSQGRLYCVSEELGVNGVRDLVSFWVLEDYDTKKWVLKDRVWRMLLLGIRSSEGSCDYDVDAHMGLFGIRPYGASRGYDVVAIHPDSNLVFIFLHGSRELISFGLDSNEVHALGTLEQDPLWFTPYVPGFLDFLSVPEHDEKLGDGGPQAKLEGCHQSS